MSSFCFSLSDFPSVSCISSGNHAYIRSNCSSISFTKRNWVLARTSIVLRISRLKIYISPEENLPGNAFRTPVSSVLPPRAELFNFRRSQHIPCHFQIALYIKLIQMKVKMNLIEIRLVLLCRRRAKTNGIAKIIGRQPRHNGIVVLMMHSP